jgi:hypothetical protein
MTVTRMKQAWRLENGANRRGGAKPQGGPVYHWEVMHQSQLLAAGWTGHSLVRTVEGHRIPGEEDHDDGSFARIGH